MSPTLQLLDAMLEDIDSPTRGKVGDMPVLKSSVLVGRHDVGQTDPMFGATLSAFHLVAYGRFPPYAILRGTCRLSLLCIITNLQGGCYIQARITKFKNCLIHIFRKYDHGLLNFRSYRSKSDPGLANPSKENTEMFLSGRTLGESMPVIPAIFQLVAP